MLLLAALVGAIVLSRKERPPDDGRRGRGAALMHLAYPAVLAALLFCTACTACSPAATRSWC